MMAEYSTQDNERIKGALAELQRMIKGSFPEATFRVYNGDDPHGTYLEAIVDIEDGDTDAVIDVFADRLVDMQVEESLPVYVIPVLPPERVAQLMERHMQLTR